MTPQVHREHPLRRRAKQARSPLLGWQKPPPIVTPRREVLLHQFKIGRLWTVQTWGVYTDLECAAPAFSHAGSQVADTIDVTAVWPTHVSNEIGLLFTCLAGNQTISFTDAQGFAEVTHQTSGGTDVTVDEILYVHWNRATSSSMGSPHIADSGNHQIAGIVTYSGCTTIGNPWDTFTSNSDGTGSTSVTAPAVTTTVPNTLIIIAVANATDTATQQTSGYTNSNLTSLTERLDLQSAAGSGGGCGIADGGWASTGSCGTTAVTLATSSHNARIVIALKPPAGGGRGCIQGGVVQGGVGNNGVIGVGAC